MNPIISDYSALDVPEVLDHLFYPRREWQLRESFAGAQDFLIPVDSDVVVGARFHATARTAHNILFFHGNGEIVADYDELAPFFTRMNINFFPVDYRGYGRSNGKPTVSALIRDSHIILDFVRHWLRENGYSGTLIVMGRSLGSASALELAATSGDLIDGLIIESGFAYAGPLLELLGVNPGAIGFREEEGFRNLDKIGTFDKPTLIIHAEYDHIIPFRDGQALYERSPSANKILLKIPGANHNDIFERALPEYMATIRAFAEKLK